MSRSIGLRSLLAWALVACIPFSDAKVKLPDWLDQAIAVESPDFNENNPPEIVVLWDEGKYKFGEDGSLYRNVRYAFRIVDSGGRSRARMSAQYIKGSAKITQLKAWAIDKEGEAYAFKNSEIEDIGITGYSLYSENRAKTIDGRSKCMVGSIFAYEYEVEEKSVFSQYRWYFQSSVPVALSRLEVVVPEGWRVEETRFNGAPKSIFADGSYLWEMRDMPMIAREKDAPYRSVKRSFITLDVRSPENKLTRHSALAFETWEDISNYTA